MMENPDRGTDQPEAPKWLAGEVGGWVSERLIAPEQAQLILARYGLVDGGESPRSLRQSQIASLVGTIGAVLVGVGVLVIVGANWEAIPRLARIVLLILATLGFYGGGYHLGYGQKTYPGVGKALILVGRTLSEDPGMKVCAEWLKTLVPEAPIRWLPVGDPYWRPTA